jgi:hypothetical protein
MILLQIISSSFLTPLRFRLAGEFCRLHTELDSFDIGFDHLIMLGLQILRFFLPKSVLLDENEVIITSTTFDQ